MQLDNKVQEQIERLALQNQKTSGLSLAKVKTCDGIGNLIVSVGGSGADMLLETKGLINQNCCSTAKGSHYAPECVAYRAFDTDLRYADVTSSESTGNIGFDKFEFNLLEQKGMSKLIDRNLLDYNKAKYPYMYPWLDTRISLPGDGSGAGGIRQVGRALLFLNVQMIYDSLMEAIRGVLADTGVTKLRIFLLSGVSGGTGSGTFLDIAYLVRKAAADCQGTGTYSMNNGGLQVVGYLLMPDVNLMNADDQTRPNILLNGGAALQELDHAMKLRQTNEYYRCRYSDTLAINTQEPPFDYVHLICANASGGVQVSHTYERCKEVAANSILSFVAGQDKADDKKSTGATAKNEFPIDSYYSNIARLQSTAVNSFPERSNIYIASGVSVWQIPMEDMVRYIFTLMFCKVNDLFKNEPQQQDVDRVYTTLGCGVDDLLATMENGYVPPLLPNEFDRKNLFGDNALDLSQYLGLDERCTDAENNLKSYIKGFETSLRETLATYFKDSHYGPIWTNHVMVTVSNYKAVDSLLKQARQDAITLLGQKKSQSDMVVNEIAVMRRGNKPFGRNWNDYCADYIELWNDYSKLQLDIYCLRLLVEDDVYPKQTSGLRTIDNTVAEINNNWLNVTEEVLNALRKVVDANTEGFNARVIENERGFTWSAGSIPHLDEALSELLEDSNIDNDKVMAHFLSRLLEQADKWSYSNANITSFVENFLEEEAQSAVQASLDGLLARCFEGDNLVESVEKELMPKLVTESKALFAGNNTPSSEARFISIPAGCEKILQGVENYTVGKSNFNIATSYLRNRISIISTSIGISLNDYRVYEQCEAELGRNPNATGLYLFQGVENVVGRVNWMEMPLPSVMPRRKRVGTHPAPERIDKFEQALLQEFKGLRTGKYPCLNMVKTPDGNDYSLYLRPSRKLVETDYYEIIKEENYTNHKKVVERSKLEELIKKLENYRYNGLPEVEVEPKRFTICENLVSCANQEMKDRLHNKTSAEQQRIREEIAWEVAEWFYLSAYPYYMHAKEEIEKYDEITAELNKLKEILDELTEKPARMVDMCKLLAMDFVSYKPKETGYYYEKNGNALRLAEVPTPNRLLREMLLYNRMETLRTGSLHQQDVYDFVTRRIKTLFDDPVNKAYIDEDKETFLKYYRKLDEQCVVAQRRKEDIELYLGDEDNVPTSLQNYETLSFYTTLYMALNHELHRHGGLLFERGNELELINSRGEIIKQRNPEHEEEKTELNVGTVVKSVLNGWTCPNCKEPRVGKFCLDCGAKQPERQKGWMCPNCKEERVGKFCLNCGAKQPEKQKGWMCPNCKEERMGKFCPECGARQPEKQKGWMCPNCKEERMGKFCPECGARQPEKQKGWICPNCKEERTGKFCPECGSQPPEKQKGWMCPNCKELRVGKFCPECGSRPPVEQKGWMCPICKEERTGKFCPECGSRP